VDKLLEGSGAAFHQSVYGGLVAEAIAGDKGVLLVEFHLVVFAQGYGDAALRIFGRGFPQTVLGDYKDLPGGG
jgi:hypothetical protein